MHGRDNTLARIPGHERPTYHTCDPDSVLRQTYGKKKLLNNSFEPEHSGGGRANKYSNTLKVAFSSPLRHFPVVTFRSGYAVLVLSWIKA